MKYEKAKSAYESYDAIHCKKYNGMANESSYQDSVQLLKALRKDMEVAGEEEGIAVPVLLWPKK